LLVALRTTPSGPRACPHFGQKRLVCCSSGLVDSFRQIAPLDSFLDLPLGPILAPAQRPFRTFEDYIVFLKR
jgi:hypothetical protein